MPRKPKWKPVDGHANDYCLHTKHASAVIWKSGAGSWNVNIGLSAPTEEEAKALAERQVKEAKP